MKIHGKFTFYRVILSHCIATFFRSPDNGIATKSDTGIATKSRIAFIDSFNDINEFLILIITWRKRLLKQDTPLIMRVFAC